MIFLPTARPVRCESVIHIFVMVKRTFRNTIRPCSTGSVPPAESIPLGPYCPKIVNFVHDFHVFLYSPLKARQAMIQLC
ncbi:hypothetical protein L0128_04785, partial [candidate division KSB1 bacterium]|nr:hypothetical protein [candidate division KSB1 bacterium]